MAISTSKSLRNKVMYQIFVRNFSQEGTFEKVRERLGEIKELGDVNVGAIEEYKAVSKRNKPNARRWTANPPGTLTTNAARTRWKVYDHGNALNRSA